MADAPLYLLVLAILFVGIALAIVDPILIAMLAVPGVLLIQRVGGASLNLSASDVLIVGATIVALPMLRSDMHTTRRLVAIALLFQALLLLVVVAHPFEKNAFEWGHRLVLVAGAICVGGVLGRARRASVPVIAFLVLTSALSIAAVEWTLMHQLDPATPFGLAKNFTGAMTTSALIICYLRPTWLRISQSALIAIGLICTLGLLASQSRGAMLALAAALVVGAARRGRIGRRGVIALFAVTPLVIWAVSSLLRESNQIQITSLTYRASYSALAFKEWHLSPVFGQGLRFFNEPGALLVSDAHNVVATTLAEGGLVGIFALALLIGLSLYSLWRLPAETGAIALAFVAGRFVHGMFDIYWVAGTATLPWLIVGIVCGTADADAADAAEIDLRDEPAPVVRDPARPVRLARR